MKRDLQPKRGAKICKTYSPAKKEVKKESGKPIQVKRRF
jgi:hypothetical protein